MTPDEPGPRLLRYLLDVDGAMNLSAALDIVNGGLIQQDFFYDYDARTGQFADTPYAALFEYMADYTRSFEQPITAHVLEQLIIEQEIPANIKHAETEALRHLRKLKALDSEYVYHKEQLVRNYQKLRGLEIAHSATVRLKSDPSDAMDYAIRAYHELQTRTDLTKDPLKSAMELPAFARIMTARMKETGTVVQPVGQYGLPGIDYRMGGLFPGELTLIAGSFNSGKSQLVQKTMLHNGLRGVPTVWASLENNEHQTWTRLMTVQTGISGMKITSGNLTEEERELLVLAGEELAELTETTLLIVPYDKCKNPVLLRNTIEAWGQIPKVVGVDYLNLMESYSYRSGEPWQKIKAVTMELKQQIGLHFNAAVVSPTQLNREGGKDPSKGLTTLQFNSLNQDADNIWVLWPDPDKIWESPAEGEWYSEPGEMFFELQRARNTAKGQRYKLRVEFTRGVIEECEHISSRSTEAPVGDVAHQALLGDTSTEEWVQPKDDD